MVRGIRLLIDSSSNILPKKIILIKNSYRLEVKWSIFIVCRAHATDFNNTLYWLLIMDFLHIQSIFLRFFFLYKLKPNETRRSGWFSKNAMAKIITKVINDFVCVFIYIFFILYAQNQFKNKRGFPGSLQLSGCQDR